MCPTNIQKSLLLPLSPFQWKSGHDFGYTCWILQASLGCFMAPDVVPFVHAGGSFLHLCGFLLHHDKLRVELEVEWDETGRCYLIDMSFDSDPNDRIVVCTSANSREVTGTLALPRVCIQIPVLISGSEQVFLRVCGCSFPSLCLGN